MTNEQTEVYNRLLSASRDAINLGFAVVIYTPDEIPEGVNPSKLEDMMVSTANEWLSYEYDTEVDQ